MINVGMFKIAFKMFFIHLEMRAQCNILTNLRPVSKKSK